MHHVTDPQTIKKISEILAMWEIKMPNEPLIHYVPGDETYIVWDWYKGVGEGLKVATIVRELVDAHLAGWSPGPQDWHGCVDRGSLN